MAPEQEMVAEVEQDEIVKLLGTEEEEIEAEVVDGEEAEVEEEVLADSPPTESDTRFEELEARHQGEISSMRQMLREQAQDLRTLRNQSSRVNDALTESGNIDADVLSSEQEESSSVSVERAESLSLLAETMRMNSSYADLDEVCSQDNYNMAVDILAKLAVEEEGGTLTENVSKVSEYVWGLANPYKFIYDIVKDHSPKYNAPPGVKKTGEDAPPSVANIPGGSGDKTSGWTAAKIDALPEEDLHLVPEAVYTKYMQNNLK